MYTSPVSAIEAAWRACGEARIRFVVVGNWRERDSRIGSSSVSKAPSSSSSSSFAILIFSRGLEARVVRGTDAAASSAAHLVSSL